MADLATSMTVIDACGRARVSPLLVGDPGVGKSSAVRGLASAEGVRLETVIGSLCEPQDIAGYPMLSDGVLT
ncbi:AAA family ATPase, partial [Mycobacterium tuberculosis]|nr:AAA family ATPase [Mycobacterium tuberculosis]